MNSPHYILIIKDLLKLFAPFFILVFSSYFFTKLFKIENLIDRLFGIFLFGWAQIILSVEILSLFKALNLQNLYFAHSIFLVILVLLCLIKRKNLKINFKLIWTGIRSFFQGIQLNKIFKTIIIVWLVIVLITIIYFGLNIPPYEYDAMTYHLTRAAFWMQNHTINHYYTYDIRQTVFPVNTEIGQLWIMMFTKSDSLVFLVQFFAFIFCLLVIYKILRLLNFNKGISIFSVFVFACLDEVLLQSNNPQNDLTSAVFIGLTLYFMIKSFKERNPGLINSSSVTTNTTNINLFVIDKPSLNLFSLVCIGMASGIAIGVKGYVYLYILGLIVFGLIYGKQNKAKYVKVGYILLFSVIGIVLFAGYNLVANYIDYGNPIVDDMTAGFMRIANPTLKTFISNTLRHIFSFYQLNGQDFNTIGLLNQKIFYGIHNLLNINIPSEIIDRANFPFYFSGNPIHSDLSYFGPIGYFFILPSLIYCTLFFAIDKSLRRNKAYFNKFKDCVIISVVPIVYFISYVTIFKWQPWCGRFYMGFMLILMVDFALFMDILGKYKKKIAFLIIAFLIVFISVFNSFYVLYKNSKINMFSKNGKSIFSVNYNERRYFNFGNMGEQFLDLKNLVDEKINQKSNLGISLSSVDWPYILFGDKYERYVKYIPREEILNKDIDKILKDNNLDGILIKSKVKEFGSPDMDNILYRYDTYEKLVDKQLLKIDYKNYKDYLKPLNQCQISDVNDKIWIKVSGDDSSLEFNFPEQSKNNSYLIVLKIDAPVDCFVQLFYKLTGQNYSEENSRKANIKIGEDNLVYFFLRNSGEIESIRLDPVNVPYDTKIKFIEINRLKDLKFDILNDYLLNYK